MWFVLIIRSEGSNFYDILSDDLEPEQYVEEVIGGQTLGLFIVTDFNENIR